MATNMTLDTVRTLASANGLTIPDERLPLVLRQYQAFLSTLDRLDALDMPAEIEPATTFVLPADSTTPDRRRR